MGLLDSITGMLGGQQQGGIAALLPLVNMLIGDKGQAGGLGQILGQLQQSGLQDQVTSWLGSGSNMEVSGQQLQDALGGDMMGQLAKTLNLGEGDAAGQIAGMLPGLVDKVSPNGDLDINGIDAKDVIGMLGGLLK